MIFDDFGILDNGDNSTAYQGLGGDSSNLKKDGNSSVVYQETLLPKEMTSAASSGGSGDIDKRLERMQNMRAMDNDMMKQNTRR